MHTWGCKRRRISPFSEAYIGPLVDDGRRAIVKVKSHAIVGLCIERVGACRRNIEVTIPAHTEIVAIESHPGRSTVPIKVNGLIQSCQRSWTSEIGGVVVAGRQPATATEA